MAEKPTNTYTVSCEIADIIIKIATFTMLLMDSTSCNILLISYITTSTTLFDAVIKPQIHLGTNVREEKHVFTKVDENNYLSAINLDRQNICKQNYDASK